MSLNGLPDFSKIKGITAVAIGAITVAFIKWLEYATNVYGNVEMSYATKIRIDYITSWAFGVFLIALLVLVFFAPRD